MTSLFVPLLACIPAAYGYGRLLKADKSKFSKAGLGYLLIGIAVTLAVGIPLFGLYGALDVVAEQLVIVATILMVAVALGSKDRTSVLLCLATLVSGCLLAAVTQVEAQYQGTSLVEVFESAVEEMVQSTDVSNLPLTTRSRISSYQTILPMLWPIILVVTGLYYVLCSHAAAYAGFRRENREASLEWSFSKFALPFWTVAFALVGVGCYAAGNYLASGNQTLIAVGINLMLCMRLAYVFQGFSLFRWLCDKYGMGYFMRALIILLGLYLEVSFYVICVVGLIDALADFRQLGHGIRWGRGESQS